MIKKIFISFLAFVPFSFLSIHRNLLGTQGSILDVGCGDGLFLSTLLSNNKKRHITGIDIFAKSLQKAKKTGIYTELIKGDVINVCTSLIRKQKKYDIVFCSEIIEHLDKTKGKELLRLTKKLAKKKVIYTTPKGYLEQQHEHVEHNPHQFHKSGWEAKDFEREKFIVRGLGVYVIWSQHGIGRSKNIIISSLGSFMSIFLSPIAYYFPQYAAGILAVKNIS